MNTLPDDFELRVLRNKDTFIVEYASEHAPLLEDVETRSVLMDTVAQLINENYEPHKGEFASIVIREELTDAERGEELRHKVFGKLKREPYCHKITTGESKATKVFQEDD